MFSTLAVAQPFGKDFIHQCGKNNGSVGGLVSGGIARLGVRCDKIRLLAHTHFLGI